MRPASVLRALEILLALNRYLTDETRLDRLVPYLVALLQDDAAPVRSMALRNLTQTLMLVKTLTPSNFDVFPEYVFPNTRPFSDDPEILPRETYALCVPALATTARRFLEISEAIRSEGMFGLANFQDFEGASFAVSPTKIYSATLLGSSIPPSARATTIVGSPSFTRSSRTTSARSSRTRIPP